jgi:hypothetical protein
MQRLLALLLHYANADPPMYRESFYALKERLLRRYGTFRGHDLQEIRKECYGDGWWRYEGGEPCGPKCRRCGGTGVYDMRWVRLERWEWCGYSFHRPDGDTHKPPDPANVRIFGRIEHPNYGRASNEAALWLYMLCGEWSLLWRSLKSSRCCGWYWWPMLNVQRVVMELSMRLRWQKCWCGKWFPTWGSGWQCCWKCRQPSAVEEIPF